MHCFVRSYSTRYCFTFLSNRYKDVFCLTKVYASLSSQLGSCTSYHNIYDCNKTYFKGNKTGLCLYQQQKNLSLSKKSRVFPCSVIEYFPRSIQPYFRLIRFDKPIGTMLLWWPCSWSIAMATQPGQLPDIWLLALFAAGSFFMRGAGCIINDMWDSDFDKKWMSMVFGFGLSNNQLVKRTKKRPLASEELSHFQALVFLASQLSISLVILLQLNWYSVILGTMSMGLVIFYPVAKRYTYWPQVMLGVTLNWGVLLAWSGIKGGLDLSVAPLYFACVLYTLFYDTIYSHQIKTFFNSLTSSSAIGMTFNYGVLLGWSAVQGSCAWRLCLPLYVSGLMWTLVYDTIYAHQDKYDDLLIGVKSTALKLGDQTKLWLAGFAGLMVSGLTSTGIMCDQTWPYYIGVAAVAAHVSYQLSTVHLNDADSCAATFRSNSYLGFVLFVATLAGTYLQSSKHGFSEKSYKDKNGSIMAISAPSES